MPLARTPGRASSTLLSLLLLAACRTSTPSVSDTPAGRPGPEEPLASVGVARASDIPRCQQDLRRLCPDPLAALGESADQDRRRSQRESDEESEDEQPQEKRTARSPGTCEPGKARECYAIATLLEREEGMKAALPSFVQSCRQGFVSACDRLVRAFAETSKDSPSPAAKACELTFATEACLLGSAEGCIGRINGQLNADGPAFDIACGTAAMERACELGSRPACQDLPDSLRWTERRVLTEAAVRWDEQACSLGVGHSCASVGRSHELGRDTPADIAKALRLLEEGCDLGPPSACLEFALLSLEHAKTPAERQYAELQLRTGLERTQTLNSDRLVALRLAAMYETGDTLARAPQRTRLLLDQLAGLCRQVSPAEQEAARALKPAIVREREERALKRASSACLELGLAREAGIGGPADLKAARELYARSCGITAEGCTLHWLGLKDSGDSGQRARAQEQLKDKSSTLVSHAAEFLQASERLSPVALRLAEEACSQGDAEACVRVARLLSEGGGSLAPDPAGALTRFESLCSSGSHAACEYAAMLLSSGKPGIQPNEALTIELSHRACAGDIGQACVRLARLQEEGRIPAGRDAPPEELYQKHCGPRVKGCWRPALKWLEQSRDEKEKALTWLQFQCNVGEPEACAELGNLFLQGRHVLQDGYAAADFLSRACTREHGASCLRLAELLEKHGGPRHAADAEKARTEACRLQIVKCPVPSKATGRTP